MRRILILLTVIALGALGGMPSEAATKRKPAPIKKSYTLKLTPDPTGNATGAVPGSKGCSNLNPTGKSTDKRNFIVPAAGKLTIKLNSPDPLHAVPRKLLIGTDWDLWLMDTKGAEIASAHTQYSQESINNLVFKKRTVVNIQVCNLAGQEDGKVDILFVYA